MKSLLPFKVSFWNGAAAMTVFAGVLFCPTPHLRGEKNAAEVTAYDPTASYQSRRIEGWSVLVNTNLLAEPALCERTLKQLGAQLDQITRAVPAVPLEKLRRISIWVERASEKFPCMCYHESREWLSTHGVNPEKTGTMELANATNFLAWTREQPWMVLHELAHAYHQQFLPENQDAILRCYEHAKAAKLYDSVLRSNGRRERHYAMNNEKEYFAEMTEAFFGTNDFYPFVRAELKEHDPEMFRLLGEVWEVKTR
ncbi:MAG: hypothetical protein ABIQ35_00655 [Verrucomicrobiota bacterium]